MGKLNINPYDNHAVMQDMSELLEDLLGRPISELEEPRKLIDDARKALHTLRRSLPVAKGKQVA